MRQKEGALRESWWRKLVTLTYLHSSQSVGCQLSERLEVWYTPALWIACGQASTGDGFLSMNSASPLGYRRAGAFTPSPITGFDVVSTFCEKGKKMWCMWWDNWCLSQIESVLINSNWRWHGDLDDVCVRMYDRSSIAEGVDDAWLKMIARSCHQTGIIRSQQNSIPSRLSVFCRLGMVEEDNLADLLERDSTFAERCQQLT